MTYFPNNANGQATMANSAPVVIASDQSSIAVTAAAGTNLNTSALALDATLTGGNQQVQGNIASAATDSGNPLKVGAKFSSTPPTFTDGQRGDLQITSRGELNVNIKQSNNSVIVATSLADATSNTVNVLGVTAYQKVFNGSTWDRAAGTTNGAYHIIRDAAGNARGANVTAANALVVDNSAVLPPQAPAGTALNTYSVHLTTNTTTTPTSSTAYISSIVLSSEVAGTTSTATIQDKQGTPLKLVNGFSTTTLTTTPTVVNFQTPVKMVSGIDIITAGAVAATLDVWINYYQ